MPRRSKFLKSYAGIIEDGSLYCRAENNFAFIRDVVFTKGRSRTDDNFISFDLSWRIGLLDGRTMIVDVSASPYPDDEEISNKITLSRVPAITFHKCAARINPAILQEASQNWGGSAKPSEIKIYKTQDCDTDVTQILPTLPKLTSLTANAG